MSAEVRIITITVDELEERIEAAVRRVVGASASVEWLDQDAVAMLLGVARSTVPTLCQRDGLPHTRIGRVYRFRRADVEAWLEERATEAGRHGRRHGATLRALRR